MPEKKVSGEMSDGESDQMKEAQDCVLCISTFIYWSFFQMRDGAGVRGWGSGEVVRSMQRMGTWVKRLLCANKTHVLALSGKYQ